MQAFRRELIEALSSVPKSISPKWLYDSRGSELFEDITRVDEYYPTRQEKALMARTIPVWRDRFGQDSVLVELGSGASEKTRIVLDEVKELGAYVPIDISQSALEQATTAIRTDYPELQVHPVLGDFSNLPTLPEGLPKGRRIGFFPGSTLGNLDDVDAITLLASCRRMLGQGSAFILGVDLIKERSILEAAYDDAKGITAAFNLNLLTRANRELGTDFDLRAFKHKALWNEDGLRMEMHLEAQSDVEVSLDDQVFQFAKGETLHTESSRKFSREIVDDLVKASGWRMSDFRASGAPSVALAFLEN